LLVSLGVPENKQVGTLTERQRLALAAVLTAKNHRPDAEHDAHAGPAHVPQPPLAARERALTAA
jgi:hypothetical protein